MGDKPYVGLVVLLLCVTGVVVLSLVVGLGINAAGEEGAPLLSVIKSLYAVVEKILIAIFW